MLLISTLLKNGLVLETLGSMVTLYIRRFKVSLRGVMSMIRSVGLGMDMFLE